jgi:hypothetical protein
MIKLSYILIIGLIGCSAKSLEMKTNKTIQLDDFRNEVTSIALEIKKDFPNLYFDYAGIIPEENENARYDSSPINATVFARTGGDGVHYSILEISENIQPVIMTVPMNFGDSMNEYNLIIGENLNEFLSIGYYNGWFPIEQLCYDNKWAIEFYSKENQDDDYQKDGDFQFVKKLREKLNYKHVVLDNDRLKELETKYFKELKFNQDFINKYIKPKDK